MSCRIAIHVLQSGLPKIFRVCSSTCNPERASGTFFGYIADCILLVGQSCVHAVYLLGNNIRSQMWPIVQIELNF